VHDTTVGHDEGEWCCTDQDLGMSLAKVVQNC